MSNKHIGKVIVAVVLVAALALTGVVQPALGKYVSTTTGGMKVSEFVVNLLNNSFSLVVTDIKEVYKRNEVFQNPKVTVKYADSRDDKVLTPDQYSISEVDMSKPGLKTATITYEEEGKLVSSSISFKVNAIASIYAEPIQEAYNVGTVLTAEHFNVRAVTNEGKATELSAGDYEIIYNQADMQSAGYKEITISYTEGSGANQVTLTTTCTIHVVNINKITINYNEYDGKYHRLWWFAPAFINVSGWNLDKRYDQYAEGDSYEATYGEIVSGFTQNWYAIQRAHADAPRQDPNVTTHGLEFLNNNNWFGLTIDNALPYTTIGINCNVGYDAELVGFGYYIGDDVATLQYVPPAAYINDNYYGPYGAAAYLTFTLQNFKPGETYYVHWVAVFEDGIQDISTWTVNMKAADDEDECFVDDPNRPNVNVVVLAGQSNACGPAPITTQIANTYGNTEFSNVYMHYTNIEVQGTTSIHHFSNTGFDQYQLGYGGWGSNYFGPELGIASYLSTTATAKGEPWYIIKFAATGTTLDTQWINGGHLYDEMAVYVRDAIDELKAQGFDPQIRSFLWMQGENDASLESTASAYAGNEQLLVSRFRSDFADCATRASTAPNVPGSGISFIDAGIAPNPDGLKAEGEGAAGGPNNWIYASAVNNAKYKNCSDWFLPTVSVAGSVFSAGIPAGVYENNMPPYPIKNAMYIDTAALVSKYVAYRAGVEVYELASDQNDWAHYSADSMFSLGNWFGAALDYMRKYG